MSKDYLNINIPHLTPDIDFNSVDAVHSVGLSHIGEYLAVFYGEEIPQDERVKRLTNNVLGSLAVLSTSGSEELVQVFTNKPEKYVPHWLRVFTPVVDTSKALGRNIDLILNRGAITKGGDEDVASNDLTYQVGLLDVASFIIAAQLELEHPRFQFYQLIDRARGVMPAEHKTLPPPSQTKIFALDFLLATDIIPIKTEHKKKIHNLRLQGQKIISHTEENIIQIRRRFSSGHTEVERDL